jgi:hypothetical protein
VIYFRYGVGGFFALLGAIALSANSYLLGRGAVRYAHEHDIFEQIALAAGGAIVPWALALMPMLFAVIVTSGFLARWGSRGLIVLLWSIFFFYNFMMGTSNLAKLREDSAAVADHGRDTLSAKKASRKAKYASLEAIPPHRPAETVDRLLAAERANRRWTSTKGCTDATVTTSREFCDNYRTLEGELASAREANKLSVEIAALDRQIEAAPPTTSANADPFVDAVHGFTGFSKLSIRVVLAMLTPFILEVMGAAFWKVATILFGWSLKPQEPDEEGPPQQLYSPEAINRVPPASLEALTRARSICEWFFRECAKPAPGGALLEREWFEQYADICRRQNDVPLPIESFRRIAARNVGLDIHDVETGDNGEMEKHYFGYLPAVPAAPLATT